MKISKLNYYFLLNIEIRYKYLVPLKIDVLFPQLRGILVYDIGLLFLNIY
jgi:hypothetical protein